MTVRAVMRDGSEHELAARHGATVEEVSAKLTETSLTGSAVPLAGLELETAAGDRIAYEDVNALVDEGLF